MSSNELVPVKVHPLYTYRDKESGPWSAEICRFVFRGIEESLVEKSTKGSNVIHGEDSIFMAGLP